MRGGSRRRSASGSPRRKRTMLPSACRATFSTLSKTPPPACGVSDDLVERQQRIVGGRRLGIERVETRAAQLAADQRVVQRLLVDQLAARGVDQHGAVLHRRDRRRVDHFRGLRASAARAGSRCRSAPASSASEHKRTFSVRSVSSSARRGVEVDQRRASKPAQPASEHPADVAEADEPDGLAGDLEADLAHLGLRPLTLRASPASIYGTRRYTASISAIASSATGPAFEPAVIASGMLARARGLDVDAVVRRCPISGSCAACFACASIGSVTAAQPGSRNSACSTSAQLLARRRTTCAKLRSSSAERPTHDLAHGRRPHVEAGDEMLTVGGPGSSIVSIRLLSDLPCASCASERVTPPPSARSITKLSACSFGSS